MKTVARQHPGNGSADDFLGSPLFEITQTLRAETTGVTCITIVKFPFFLSGDLKISGVDDDNVIPIINIGREVGFIFSGNQAGDMNS